MAKRKKTTGLAKFIIYTLLVVAASLATLTYGPSILNHLRHNTPNYRAFGVSVPVQYDIVGIDVSKYQGKIDWEKVKEMRSGKHRIHFVFAKATEGLELQDKYYNRNRSHCQKFQIPFGAYHFFLPTKDPVKQADFFVGHFSPKTGDLPPVVDIETSGGLTKKQICESLRQHLQRIEQKTGVVPIIYTYHSFYKDYLNQGFEKYPFWLAHYGPGTPHDQPWTIWQFSEQSTISGINHRVDLNVFKGDSTAFQKLRKQ